MILLVIVVILAALCNVGEGSFYRRNYINITDEEALIRARQVLSQYPLVDGHNDLPHQFRKRVQNRVDDIDLSSDASVQWGTSHTDIPRLRDGQVGATFWANYISCTKNHKDAVRATLEQTDVIHRMVQKYPDDFAFVTSADELEAAFADGKIGSLIGIEGGHGLDSSMGALRMMYALGARYLGLTHNCDTHWSANHNVDDDPEPPVQGLTPFGEVMIQEMNRLGIIVDLAHVAKGTMIDAINLSAAPVMISHSNAWSLCQHTRNVQDDVLQLLQANNGVIMVTFHTGFLNCFPSNGSPLDIALVADHIEYIRDQTGADHVGLGGDFDGTQSLPGDLYDVSRFPYLFAEMVKRGWSDLDLEKLAGRNIVRVLRGVEQVRDNQVSVRPFDEWVPAEDIVDPNGCRTTE